MTDIASYIDLTLLTPNSPLDKYSQLLDLAYQHAVASICIPPCRLEYAKVYSLEKGYQVPLGTVIGFPLGYHTTETKMKEVHQALKSGADQLDVVVNRLMIADGKWRNIKQELEAILLAIHDQGKVMKWIVESTELTDLELNRVIDIANETNLDYLKTSTGHFGGATIEAVKLMKHKLNPNIKIKASGGIKTRELALQMISAGASRIGASSLELLH